MRYFMPGMFMNHWGMNSKLQCPMLFSRSKPMRYA